MVIIFHYTAVNAKQFDGLNIDGLAGKRQKRQIPPVKILHYTVYTFVSFYASPNYVILHYIEGSA